MIVWSSHLYAFIGTFFLPNWSIIRCTVSLRFMFENWQIDVIEGKYRRFQNSSECLNNHCAANNWLIWMQKVPKEAWRCVLQIPVRIFAKIFCFTYLKGRLSKILSVVHAYVIPRTVYFDWIYISKYFHWIKSSFKVAWHLKQQSKPKPLNQLEKISKRWLHLQSIKIDEVLELKKGTKNDNL